MPTTVRRVAMPIGRVLCVIITSATGHVIIERFYDRLGEKDQLRWRERLNEASSSSVGVGGSAKLSVDESDRVAEACGTSRHEDECLAWIRVGNVRFYAVGSGEYDELARASLLPIPPDNRDSVSFFKTATATVLASRDQPRSLRPLLAVAEVLQALVTSTKGTVKKGGLDDERLFAQYGMLCLALDEIVSDGVVDAIDWDTARRGTKLKMSETHE